MIEWTDEMESAYEAMVYDRKPLTQQQATDVWLFSHELGRIDEGLYKLFFLLQILDGETNRGKRCAVCARYENPSCSWEC